MVVVQSHGRSLRDVVEKMKQDKAVVMVAVQSDGLALQYAAQEMKQEVTQSTSHVHVVVAAQPIG